MKYTLLPAFGLFLALALPAFAACAGRDLIAALPETERAALRAEADVPYARGNFWQARKGPARILLVGTYHLGDDRFAATARTLTPALQAAGALLVEIAPEDEKRLKTWLATHPEAVFDQTGTPLRDRLSPEDWAALSAAVQARGTPPSAILKMRPWIVASLLEAPACMTAGGIAANQGLDQGLDRRLMALASAQGLAIRSLEPFDTALRIFDDMAPEDQMDMIRQALQTEAEAEDMAATLTAAYFRGESQLYMAFARAEAIRSSGLGASEVDRQIRVMYAALLDRRNAAWIPVLEDAAAKGPVVAAFGALHLPGDQGIAALLEARGWTVQPWTPGEAWPE